MNAVEIRLFQDLRRSNALKAWLIVYSFGMQDPLLRTLLKTGCQPWEEDYFFVGSLKSYWFFGFLVVHQKTIEPGPQMVLVLFLGFNGFLSGSLAEKEEAAKKAVGCCSALEYSRQDPTTTQHHIKRGKGHLKLIVAL